MVHTSFPSEDRDGGTPSPSEVRDSPGTGRPLVTDGGTATEGSADDEDSVYDKHSYDFAWYFTKRIGWRTVLAGTILAVTSFLVVPGLVLLGYTYRVARSAARGEASPPPLENWKALATDGARFLVLLVPAALLSVIPLLGSYVGLAVLAAYVGTDSLTDPATYGRALRLVVSVRYLVWFVEYLVYLVGLWLLTVILIGIGWVFGPGFIVISSGSFLGYVYYHAADRDMMGEPAP